MIVTIANGKYTVVCDEVKGLRALRYGEEWRDLTGDNLVAELAFEIEELRTAIEADRKRRTPPSEPFAIVIDRIYDGEGPSLAYWNGENYQFSDGDCFNREGDTLDGYTAEFLTDYQLEQRLFSDRKRRGEPVELDRYDAGYLGGQDGMAAHVWHDIIRAELDRAYDFYMDQLDRATPQPADLGKEMTKPTMPEPAGYFACDPETLEPVWDEGCVCQDDIYNQEDFGTIGRPFIFTTQAEAYADARVREAIEADRQQRGEPKDPPGDNFGSAEHWKEKAQYWANESHKLSQEMLRSAQPPAPAQEPGFEVRERGFLYENGKHTPTLLLAFPIGDWDSRDRLAAMLANAPKFGEEE